MRSVRFVALLVLGLAVAALGSSAAERPSGRYYGAKLTEYPAWFKRSFLDLREDIGEAAAAGKRLMIVFHQEGCPYCNALVERNFSQREIVDYTRRHFDVIELNIWGDREVTDLEGRTTSEKAFASALKVQFTPTLLFFDERGRVVLRLNGYWPPERFALALRYVAEGHHERGPLDEFLARLAPAASAAGLLPEPFFAPPPYDLRAAARPRDKPLAVFFEQAHCPDCERLHRRVLTDPAVREEIRAFHVVQLDRWSDTELVTPRSERTTARAWASQLGIGFLPTIVLFAADGTEVIRAEAALRPFHVAGLFAYVSSGAWRKQPSFQRFLAARAESLRAAGQDVDIWRYADEPIGAGGIGR